MTNLLILAHESSTAKIQTNDVESSRDFLVNRPRGKGGAVVDYKSHAFATELNAAKENFYGPDRK
jgi:hypothetical protein